MKGYAMKLPVCLCLFCIMIVCPVAGAAVVIDHASIAGVDSLPQATMNQIGSDLSFFFAHASVGANIVAGLNQLHTTSPSYYTLTTVYEDAVPPTTTTAGRVYEYNRGNPSWQAKVDGFKTDMDNGWGAKVSVVLNKFCYIDPAVALDYYAISNANGTEPGYDQRNLTAGYHQSRNTIGAYELLTYAATDSSVADKALANGDITFDYNYLNGNVHGRQGWQTNLRDALYLADQGAVVDITIIAGHETFTLAQGAGLC